MSETNPNRPFPPVRVHPDYPKRLLFRGRPTVLVTATEHYGAVLNRPFRIEKYLADCGRRGINSTRLFMLFREQQSANNPQSTCKPAAPDFIAPFARIGPGAAVDGEPKFDLDRPDPEFFERLHRFLQSASENNVMVEVTLLSNTYDPGVWALNPLFAGNNVNDSENLDWPDYLSQRHPKLFRRQCDHVRKIVQETCRYDNIVYEICNEPGGSVGPQYPSAAEVNDWQRAIATVIREADQGPAGPHMIVGHEAFAYRIEDESRRAGPDVFQYSDASIDSMPFDMVNMHPLSNMIARGKYYQLGQFMRGQANLAAIKQYCLDLYKESKPLCLDEDNCATQYRDAFGWRIHRKRAWVTVFSGGHYNCIDFTINNYLETGYSDHDPQGIRRALANLATFINTDNRPLAKPSQAVVKQLPEHCIEATLLGDDGRVFVYLADAREHPRGEAISAVRGAVNLALKRGKYRVQTFSPLTAAYSPWIAFESDGNAKVELGEFTDDVVLLIEPA